VPLFADILGQELALTVLRQALATGASHAYLLTGPPGVGKSEAAIAFAGGLTCSEGGCAVCDTCRRVRLGLHPDVEIVSAEGAFITIDQIRAINKDVVLRPFEARARVYVLFDAENMNREAANAFLKTLEEPPGHSHFILVSSSPEELPPTIVSRCQKVPFQRVATSLLADHLRSAYGCSDVEAVAYARVAQGRLAYARELATDAGTRAHRERLVGWARAAATTGPLDAQVMLEEILASVEARADARVAVLEAEKADRLQWAGDARTKSRLEKQHEQRVKRERRRAVTGGMEEVLGTFSHWYRDLAAAAVGADDAVLNHDFLFELRGQSFPGMVDRYLGAVSAVGRTRDRFRYNVDARCALEEMLFSIREAFQ